MGKQDNEMRSDTMTKRSNMSQSDTDYGAGGETGERIPAGASRADTVGERKEKLVGGVAMGKADSIGSREKSHMGQHDGQCGEMKGNAGNKPFYKYKKEYPNTRY